MTKRAINLTSTSTSTSKRVAKKSIRSRAMAGAKTMRKTPGSQRRQQRLQQMRHNLHRWRDIALGLAPEECTAELGLIGKDVSQTSQRLRPRLVFPLVGLALIAALGVVALRIDMLRIQYALGEMIEEEKSLQAEKRILTASMRKLRDPARLADRARKLGFVRPERLIDLPGPIDRRFHAPASAQVLADAHLDMTPPWVRKSRHEE
jgi:hypothetical protein